MPVRAHWELGWLCLWEEAEQEKLKRAAATQNMDRAFTWPCALWVRQVAASSTGPLPEPRAATTAAAATGPYAVAGKPAGTNTRACIISCVRTSMSQSCGRMLTPTLSCGDKTSCQRRGLMSVRYLSADSEHAADLKGPRAVWKTARSKSLSIERKWLFNQLENGCRFVYNLWRMDALSAKVQWYALTGQNINNRFAKDMRMPWATISCATGIIRSH